MSEKMKKTLTAFFLILFCFSAYAGEDDYVLGINAFGDGLFSLSKMSLEQYVATGTDQQKKNYSAYLLYRIYLKEGKYSKSLEYFSAVGDIEDARFDKKQMQSDSMLLLAKTDCKRASELAFSNPDDMLLDVYLGTECPVDGAFVKLVLEKSKTDNTKLKAVTRVADKPELVKSIFGSMDLAKLSNTSKRYFALYFYQHKEYELFWKIRDNYEDADVVSLELDRYWTKGDKSVFIDRFEKYRGKYALGDANACRAIDFYGESGRNFDCNLVNECIKDYTVQFVKVKGACLAKKGDAKMLTEFSDSLGSKIFQGLCGYGEYIFSNGLYTGTKESKFSACDNKFLIADVMAQKKAYRSLVRMFDRPQDDTERYYTVIGLLGQGKKDEAKKTADKIKDSYLKSKLTGGGR